jgi:hypothetical protein
VSVGNDVEDTFFAVAVCGWDGRQWTEAIGASAPDLLYYFRGDV